MRTFRALLAEASADPTIIARQWDVTAAFLHAPIDTELYMQQPEGFVDPNRPNAVFRLKKSVYGCKQASHLFYEFLRKEILATATSIGATAQPSRADECLFIVRRGKSWLKMVTHVDDFCVTANDQGFYDEIYAALSRHIKLKDDPLTHFLGLVINRKRSGAFHIRQTTYIDSLVQRLGISTSGRPVLSPTASGKAGKLSSAMSPADDQERSLMSSIPYREAVGALHYLARGTRFDISLAVSQVARYLHDPGMRHWQAVLRIYRFLHCTRDTPYVIDTSSGGMLLEGYTDASWADCLDTSKSTASTATVAPSRRWTVAPHALPAQGTRPRPPPLPPAAALSRRLAAAPHTAPPQRTRPRPPPLLPSCPEDGQWHHAL